MVSALGVLQRRLQAAEWVTAGARSPTASPQARETFTPASHEASGPPTASIASAPQMAVSHPALPAVEPDGQTVNPQDLHRRARRC